MFLPIHIKNIENYRKNFPSNWTEQMLFELNDIISYAKSKRHNDHACMFIHWMLAHAMNMPVKFVITTASSLSHEENIVMRYLSLSDGFGDVELWYGECVGVTQIKHKEIYYMRPKFFNHMKLDLREIAFFDEGSVMLKDGTQIDFYVKGVNA